MRTRFTPRFASKRATLRSSAGSVMLPGGPLTAQKRTGPLLSLKTKWASLAVTRPCSPANFSLSERRSIGLGEKSSGGGEKGSQSSEVAAGVESEVRSRKRISIWASGVEISANNFIHDDDRWLKILENENRPNLEARGVGWH